MISRRESADESAQVHILEMITLFWLFFMTATFILQLKVPDPTSPASDGIWIWLLKMHTTVWPVPQHWMIPTTHRC